MIAASMTAADSADVRARILGHLDEVKDPCSVATGEPMGLAEMGLVKSVDISEHGAVSVVLRLTSPFCEMIGFLKSEAVAKIAGLPTVASVTVESDSGFDWSPEDMAPHLRQRREERLRAVRADVAAHRLLPLIIERRDTSS